MSPRNNLLIVSRLVLIDHRKEKKKKKRGENSKYARKDIYAATNDALLVISRSKSKADVGYFDVISTRNIQ